jgi:hypothetical protein
MVNNMECFDEYYSGPKPKWLENLTPANYEDYQKVWESITFSNFDELFYGLIEQCNLGEIIFEEEIVENNILRALKMLGFSYATSPPYEDNEARDAWWEARRTAQDTLDIAKMWWDALNPMTGDKLKLNQLVFNISSHGGSDSKEWTDCTIYEQVDVDDFSEYPGSKLCDVILQAYLLVDTALPQVPYQFPVAYYVHDVEIDEDSIHSVKEQSYEPDWDSMPGGHDDY